MADLGSMTDEQREKHYQAVCKSLDLDPTLRLLDYIWMNNDQGPKSMVLYARRGAAEVFRQKRNISITNTSQVESNGYILFIVNGTDGTGRIESAVGAASIKDLKGERLAYAIMTAHTRATRRLTLQFVGQGILDESEVNGPTADLGSSPAAAAALAGSSAVFPPPQVPTTAAPGKDITSKPAETPANSEPISVQVSENQSVTYETTPAETSAKPKRTRKKRNTVDIASPGQEVNVTDQPILTAEQAAVNAPVYVAKVDPDFAAKQQALRDAATKQLDERFPDRNKYPTPPPMPSNAPTQSPEKQALESKAAVKPKEVNLIAPEKLADYRARLAKFSQDILPKAGMMPSDGVGGVTMKLRKFATVHTGADSTKLTEEQWNDLLGFLESQKDPKALVEYINKAIGVA